MMFLCCYILCRNKSIYLSRVAGPKLLSWSYLVCSLLCTHMCTREVFYTVLQVWRRKACTGWRGFMTRWRRSACPSTKVYNNYGYKQCNMFLKLLNSRSMKISLWSWPHWLAYLSLLLLWEGAYVYFVYLLSVNSPEFMSLIISELSATTLSHSMNTCLHVNVNTWVFWQLIGDQSSYCPY